ncbi:MAG TPA: hypothetical protein K8U77_01880, partial [Slackia equolifaciens]|nr:hypothetical protein [Slackia equolifaciens]
MEASKSENESVVCRSIITPLMKTPVQRGVEFTPTSIYRPDTIIRAQNYFASDYILELRQNPGPRVARQEGAVYSREFKERTLADLAESGMTVAA